MTCAHDHDSQSFIDSNDLGFSIEKCFGNIIGTVEDIAFCVMAIICLEKDRYQLMAVCQMK